MQTLQQRHSLAAVSLQQHMTVNAFPTTVPGILQLLYVVPRCSALHEPVVVTSRAIRHAWRMGVWQYI